MPNYLRRSGTLPHFLVIGAMKAGTTTLYRDMLVSMPNVFLPADKEPDALVTSEILTTDGQAQYGALFARAGHGQICGEASTAYTKRPDYEGVAKRARILLGTDVRLIYLMRHPVERIVSQLRHEQAIGCDVGDPNVAVRRVPRFIAYSRYAYQLEPWIDCFGAEALLPISFEEYVANRVGTLERVGIFLGAAFDANRVSHHLVYNQTEAKPVVTKRWELAYASPLYRRVVRPWLGPETRERLRRLMLPKAHPKRVDFDDATRAYLVDQLAPDVERLREMLGPQAPQWDLKHSKG